MLSKFWLLSICIILAIPSLETAVFSRGKQQKFFPKELKDTDVYLGMTLEKFTEKRPNAIIDTVVSVFKIKYTEPSDLENVASYTYLLTQSESPKIYAIEITYTSMDKVQSRAVEVMGKPNHKGEWRMAPKTIKEDFMMGAWTFGQKLVYGGTLKYSEWEKGFEN